jgi:hypothetical protein
MKLRNSLLFALLRSCLIRRTAARRQGCAALLFALHDANFLPRRKRQDSALLKKRARVSSSASTRSATRKNSSPVSKTCTASAFRVYSPSEQIDRRTWIERMHDFKAHLWWLVRSFFRGQFTDEARDSFREQQGKLGKRSQVVGQAQFARIPIAESKPTRSPLEAQNAPGNLVSETQQLPIDGLSAGVYLIEATDGDLQSLHRGHRHQHCHFGAGVNGKADLYVADRKTGAPVQMADVALWADKQQQSTGKTGADGLASLTMKVRGEAQGATHEDVWILARHGADTAIITPYGYAFGADRSTDLTAFVYTDRPVYRPGHTVHIKAVIRKKVGDALDLPDANTVTLTVTDADNKAVFKQDLPVSAHGTVTADLTLDSTASLGFYDVAVGGERWSGAGSGSFYVEEYKKPEYQVTVKPAVPRVLQSNSLQATIEARYFFGEPVANAKVKYVVHTSQHYWWDEDEADSDDVETDNSSEDSADSDYATASPSSRSRKAFSMQMAVLPSRFPQQSTASKTIRTTALKRE